jgi:hypothetical protein
MINPAALHRTRLIPRGSCDEHGSEKFAVRGPPLVGIRSCAVSYESTGERVLERNHLPSGVRRLRERRAFLMLVAVRQNPNLQSPTGFYQVNTTHVTLRPHTRGEYHNELSILIGIQRNCTTMKSDTKKERRQQEVTPRASQL